MCRVGHSNGKQTRHLIPHPKRQRFVPCIDTEGAWPGGYRKPANRGGLTGQTFLRGKRYRSSTAYARRAMMIAEMEKQNETMDRVFLDPDQKSPRALDFEEKLSSRIVGQ